MNRRDFLQTISTAVPVAAATALMTRSNTESPAGKDKDITERILDTRKINCGYIPYAPVFMKNPNTGEMSGIFFDLTERLGELAGLETIWNVETTWATFAQDMQQGKYDVFGSGILSNTNRAKEVNSSIPVLYSGYGIYVRKSDNRFSDNYAKLNDPQYRIATIDGEMSQIIQQSDYAKASVLGLPNTTDISMLAENIVDGKADATFMEKAAVVEYMRKNPDALRNIATTRPIRLLENIWTLPYGSDRLKHILDTAIKEMICDGYVDNVLTKYGQQDGFYRVRPSIQ